MAPLSIEVLTYAPTEFFHCMHCEVTMQAVGLGQAVHREQRAAPRTQTLKLLHRDRSGDDSEPP